MRPPSKLWKYLCCNRTLRRLFWWVCEHEGLKEATRRDLAHTEVARGEIGERLNNVRLSMRTHVPLSEIERL